MPSTRASGEVEGAEPEEARDERETLVRTERKNNANEGPTGADPRDTGRCGAGACRLR